ncbi:hypothetical protein BDZ94DRAFT_1270269 [Collybia nuda]|uniref:DUF6533 domain-containing protein n=1 Tax=Collybia nuda TaxID=64659 RepID=A0A9P5XVN8_9AGAR|nr:hypothetical protein BDZ94DRAFT_1270269 [Collybia nuda]
MYNTGPPSVTWGTCSAVISPYAEMIDLGTTHFLQFCIQYASIALLYYDYALTFSLEVKYIWTAKIRMTTILYSFCRYGLVANVVYLLNIGNGLNISCDNGYRISGALSVLGRISIVVIWTARTYALFNRSKIILSFFTILGSSIIILSIVHVPFITCTSNSTMPKVGGLMTILMAVFEIASAALTTLRSFQALRVSGLQRQPRNGFIFLVLDQGVLYFSFMSLFTLASIILGALYPDGFLQRLLNALTLPLCGLLTARFFLHLRQWENKHSARNFPDHTSTRHSTDIQFTTLMTALSSFADEFGEDPIVRTEREHNQSTIGNDLGVDNG